MRQKPEWVVPDSERGQVGAEYTHTWGGKRQDRWKDGQRQVEMEAQDGFPECTPIMTRQSRWGPKSPLVSLRGLCASLSV